MVLILLGNPLNYEEKMLAVAPMMERDERYYLSVACDVACASRVQTIVDFVLLSRVLLAALGYAGRKRGTSVCVITLCKFAVPARLA
jgi:hypothetical protein